MNNLRNLDVLVINAKQLNAEALTTLYDNFLPYVFRYIYYQVNNKAVAEDLTSETFIKMLTAIPDFREEGRSFYPWLLRIARNTTFDYMRSKSKQSHIALDEDIEELLFDTRNSVNPEHSALTALDAEDVRKAVGKLTDEQQQVLLLKFTMGLSNGESAKVLDKTEGSIKSLQVRALASLRKHLESTASSAAERVEPSIQFREADLFRKA